LCAEEDDAAFGDCELLEKDEEWDGIGRDVLRIARSRMRSSELGALRMSSTMLIEPLGNSLPMTGVRTVDLKPSRDPEEYWRGVAVGLDGVAATVILLELLLGDDLDYGTIIVTGLRGQIDLFIDLEVYNSSIPDEARAIGFRG
jgi:hypothetical protein